MKLEVMKKWTKALRSGKYKQGIEELKNENNEFCCLGVLCDISKKGKWGKGGVYYPKKKKGMSGLLPQSIRSWAGMHSTDGSVIVNDELATDLTSLNDTEGYSFNDIADFIETNYKDL